MHMLLCHSAFESAPPGVARLTTGGTCRWTRMCAHRHAGSRHQTCDASQDVAVSPGDQTSDFAPQLQQLPADASHLIVSVGGNDALEHLPYQTEPTRSVAEVFGGER